MLGLLIAVGRTGASAILTGATKFAFDLLAGVYRIGKNAFTIRLVRVERV